MNSLHIDTEGASLRQQYGPLEKKVKSMLNNDLKRICKSEDLAVSGVKSTLQSRVLDRLNDIISTGDAVRFNELRQKINHGGSNPYPSPQPTTPSPNVPVVASHNSPVATGYASYAGYRPTPQSAARGRLSFKKSPFYEPIESLTSPTEMPAVMHSNRNTVSCSLSLPPNTVTLLNSRPNIRVMLYCADATTTYTNQPVDISWPSSCEIRVNDEHCQLNLKGLKKKPGTTRPGDITDKIRKLPNYNNRISATYAGTDKKFIFVAQLVRVNHVQELIKGLLDKGRFLTKQRVIYEMSKRVQDDDLVATSTVMSLKCPFSYCRMTIPVRSNQCNHNQCYDAESFLQSQEQAPQWICPVCDKPAQFDMLVIDQYVQEILQTCSQSVEQVTIEPDGQWRPGGRIDEQQPTKADPQPRNSWDAEELVELRVPNNYHGFSYSTPKPYEKTPTSNSREPSTAATARSTSSKRPANDVIDLTLSDDDEPPRPLKRQSTSSSIHTQFSNNNSSRPAPLPTPPAYQQQQRFSMQLPQRPQQQQYSPQPFSPTYPQNQYFSGSYR